MNYIGGNQVVVDLDSRSRHDMVGPFRIVVSGFSRYAETVHSLPLLERIKLVLVTDFVGESYLPGNLPIIGIRLIGHADTDPQGEQHEPGLERKISEKRVAAIENDLKDSIARSMWMHSGRNAGPKPDQIRWVSSGGGASQPNEENLKRGKTHANMTEQDRKLNRRVQIFLEPGPTPVPEPVDPWGLVIQGTKQWERRQKEAGAGSQRQPVRPGVQPPPLPPSPLFDPKFRAPKNKDEYIEFKCSILEKLKKFDVDTTLSTLKDIFLKDPSETSDWTNSGRQFIDEIEKRRTEKDKEWWRDEDCGQQPPPAARKVRLVIEPRVVTVKRGGDAVVKVSVVNRPYGGSIEINLHSLPAKVTAPITKIPEERERDYTVIQLHAAADAPVATVRSVFANAYYPNVVTLQSDMFTVNVE